MVLLILTAKKLVELFKKKFEKTNQIGFKTENVGKRKDNKLYLKLKGYDNSFNSWIDKKRHNIKIKYF